MRYQNLVRNYVYRLVEERAPDEVSHNLRAIINLHLQSYSAVLMHSNYEAYETLLLSGSAHEPHIADILEKAKASLASPIELLTLNTQTDIRSVELKKLSHPFGLRSEYLDEMDSEVMDAVEKLGGEVFIDSQPDSEINILPHQYDTDGFIVTARELMGKVDDVLIKKRRTFVVNVDSPNFDSEVQRRVKEVDPTLPHPKWFEEVVNGTGLAEYVAASLAQPDEPSGVYPLSTMIYSFNPDRKKPKGREEKRIIQGRQLARQAFKNKQRPV